MDMTFPNYEVLIFKNVYTKHSPIVIVVLWRGMKETHQLGLLTHTLYTHTTTTNTTIMKF